MFSADENRQIPPQPPYNATNFTPANAVIYNTMVNNAKTQPNYPLNSGSDSDQINRQIQNVSYFTSLQQQTQNGTKPFPAFRLDQRRLMYIQGQYATASRNIITKENTSGPAGVPFYTAPSAPTIISAIQGIDGIVITFTGPAFTFTSPNQSAESNILSYQIRYSNPMNSGTSIAYSSPYTITGLSATTSYQCMIAAVNAGGVGLFSTITSYVIPSPTEFQAIPLGISGTVTVYFDVALTAFNTGIYTVYQYKIIAVNNVNPMNIITQVYTPPDNTATSYIYTFTGLTDGVPYTFYISARINPSSPQYGYPVPYANVVVPFSPPLALTHLRAEIPSTGGTNINVTFQQPINGENADNNKITEYAVTITRMDTNVSYSHSYTPTIMDSGSTQLTHSVSMDAMLSIGVSTPIMVTVSETNAAGISSASYSSTVTATQLSRSVGTTSPSTPVLHVTTSINTVYLIFEQTSTGGLQNTYQYSTNGIYTTFVPQYTGYSYYYKITNIQGGQYMFAVKATNSKGFSVSNNVTVTVPSVPMFMTLTQQLKMLLR